MTRTHITSPVFGTDAIKINEVTKAGRNFIFVVEGKLGGKPLYATMVVDMQRSEVAVGRTRGLDYESLGGSIADINALNRNKLLDALEEKLKEIEKAGPIQSAAFGGIDILSRHVKEVLNAVESQKEKEKDTVARTDFQRLKKG
ncbi:MAG: hypothetical protein AB1468_05845 [Candidatus Micrarchaeota archaeon]